MPVASAPSNARLQNVYVNGYACYSALVCLVAGHRWVPLGKHKALLGAKRPTPIRPAWFRFPSLALPKPGAGLRVVLCSRLPNPTGRRLGQCCVYTM